MEHVWKPLLTAAKLPSRKPHAMCHTFATALLEGGADLRWVKDQLGHGNIEETEGTYGHMVVERHEPRVALLDEYLTDAARVQSRPSASTPARIAS